ncbi:MAG: hypothetical protein CMF63_09555 [Magnetovibrio sp.]|nr:hypothetical protein [Magnetovibrio sp.]
MPRPAGGVPATLTESFHASLLSASFFSSYSFQFSEGTHISLFLNGGVGLAGGRFNHARDTFFGNQGECV